MAQNKLFISEIKCSGSHTGFLLKGACLRLRLCWGPSRHSYWNFWLSEGKQVFTINHICKTNLARLVQQNSVFQALKTSWSASSIGNTHRSCSWEQLQESVIQWSPPRDSTIRPVMLASCTVMWCQLTVSFLCSALSILLFLSLFLDLVILF